MEQIEFKVGDVVVLKSGSLKMTVTVLGDLIECIFCNPNALTCSESFGSIEVVESALTLVNV